MSVEVVGLNKVKVMIDNLKNRLSQEGKTRLHVFVEEIRNDAKTLCPVDTGSLRKSIRIETYAAPAGEIHRIGVRAGGYVVNPKTGRLVDYANHVEYGTSRSPAQPYIRPAFINKQARLKSLLREILYMSVKV